MPESTPTPNYKRRALIVILAVFVFRIVYAAIFAKHPAGDEAYYWDWGRQLDYGYYSKPPFIAWLYAFVDWIGNGQLFAFRAMAATLVAISLVVLYHLTASLFNERTAWITVLLGVTAPANAVLSFFLTIDAPLVLLWTTALWMFWRFVSGKGGVGALVSLFLVLGVGHLTKQMMMVFPVLALIYLALSREHRQFLKHPGLLVALFCSYLSLLPPLIWNYHHDWITFQHTKHHFETTPSPENLILERVGSFFSFLATQLGVIGPVIAVVLYTRSLGQLKSLLRLDKVTQFLLVFGGIPIAGMLLLALRQGLQPNWPAVFYIAGFILAAHWYAGSFKTTFPPVSWRNLFPIAVSVNIALCGFFYFGPPVFAAIGLSGHKADPNRRIIQHAEVVEGFDKIRSNIPSAESDFIIALGHRDTASHLAFGLPDQPRVYRWQPDGKIISQYEVWKNPIEDGLKGANALILVNGSEKDLPKRLASSFKSIELLGSYEARRRYDQVTKHFVFRGISLKRWNEVVSPQ